MHKKIVLVCLLSAVVLSLVASVQPARAQEDQPEATNPRWVVWPVSPDPTHRTLYAIKLRAINDGWAVGAGGGALHWNGSAWIKQDTLQNATLRGVDILAGGSAYTAGDAGTIMWWDGAKWHLMDSNSLVPEGIAPANFNTISMIPSGRGWAVGTWSPPVLVWFALWDGHFWRRQESPQDHRIYAIKMINEDAGWCVGEDGALLKKSLGDFVNIASPTASHLYGLSLLSEDSGFAVGAGGAIIKLNYSWSAQTSPTTATLYSVAAVSPTDAWAVGSGGTMLHYDGASWKKVRINTNQTLYGVSFVSAMDGWAVGANGVLLRYMNLPYKKYIPMVYRETQ